MQPFHLAIPVDDLSAARRFYGELLGCPEGRSAADWVDFDFFGHQLVCHRVAAKTRSRAAHNQVDGANVPVPHFGLVLDWDAWQTLAARLTAAGVQFELAPGIRFAGQPGEQGTFFLYDPAGNALEFKAMRHAANLFAR